MKNDSVFKDLETEKLNSVNFVQDYFQLVIGTYILSIFSKITLHTQDGDVVCGQNNFRDTLCKTIGKTVLECSEDKKGLIIKFSGNISFEISFLEKDTDIPEFLEMMDKNGFIITV
ncbi:hypothetical protein [Saezia sanguinis]|uniref:hypothetical protein n=1 Tax=Saezia sanguinis TaxID=1965230 RepID=UPI00306556FA